MAAPDGIDRAIAPSCPVEVFAYLDLQAFLGAYYTAKKEEGRGFSYRAFSRRAGLRSPNHLKRVIDGGRPLTAPMAVRYADAIGLEGEARAYFLDLAAFARAETVGERNAAYDRLIRYRRSREAHRLDVGYARYHATWYVPAVRELIELPDFTEDAGSIARSLVPPITRKQADEAIELLLELGLLERDATGRLLQAEAVLTTGPETRGLHIANFHRTMMQRAAESIDLVDANERDISSLTFSCSDAVLTDIKERIVRFRRELIALLAEDSGPTRVAQLNLQLFPLSRSSSENAP